MQILLLLLCSALSGIFAGMGMGGGTFLIPLLSLFFSVEQVICQSTNVLCFVVLASVCFLIYIKDKLIDFKVWISVSIPATAVSIFASIFALKIKSNLLGFLFAGFIILVGIFFLIRSILVFKKNADSKKS